MTVGRPVTEPAGETAISPQPLFPDTGIMGMVAERWGGMWLSRQQILTRLSRYFHVVWFDPPVGWRKLWTGAEGTRVAEDSTPVPETGFSVYRQSRWLPRVYSPGFVGRFTSAERLRGAQQVLAEKGCKRTILYLWRPEYEPALDEVPHDVSCYHIADEYSFSADETPVSAIEHRVISRVDQVFIHSPALMAKKGDINPSTVFVTNGVDYRSFSTPQPEPADLRDIPHPRIGYVGRIKTQLDWGLLSTLTRRHSNWSFVFVGPMGFMGPDKALCDEVFSRPNVHYLGNKPVTMIPGYTQHMDACMLSYVVNAYTNYIFPLKLHEYLAAGRPVVGTPIRSLEAFSSVVRIERDADGWSQALEQALLPESLSGGAIAERRAIAKMYDWDDLADAIARTLCERLGPEYVETFDTQRIRHRSDATEVD